MKVKVSKTVMIDQYFDFYKSSIKEYGEKTCVIIRVGGFFECYYIVNETEIIGNANKISEVIHCEFSNKNKIEKAKCGYSSRSYPDFFGFNVNSLSKYMPMLLNAGYTVVVVDQIEDAKKGQLVKRDIVTVCSPTLKLPEYELNDDTETCLICITLEFIKGVCLYSICSVNNVTNKIEIMEGCIENPITGDLNLDELSRILLRYNIKELQAYIINTCNLDKLNEFFKEYTCNFKINIIDTTDIQYKEYIKPSIQNEYFTKVYKNINFGLLSPLEYLELSSRQLSSLNLMYTFDFIGKHDIRYLVNLTVPNIIEDHNHLVLALNTLAQLNIINSAKDNCSVFDTINFTNTSIGKRYLKSLLCKPFKDQVIINDRYILTEKLKKCNVNLIEQKLKCIIDFERLHRKMSLESLKPYEFDKLHCTYSIINEIIPLTKELSIYPNQQTIQQFNEYIQDYKQHFDMSLLKMYNGITVINFFNSNQDLNEIENKLTSMENEVENIRFTYDKLINDKKDTPFIRLDSTEADGLFFTCTKIRFEKFKSCIDTKTFKVKTNGSTVKFTTENLTKLSFGLLNNRNLLIKKVNLHFQDKLKEYSQKYNGVFVILKEFIEILDITTSNLKCSLKYNYTQPNIIIKDYAFFNCTDIRHCIIERISETEYITNDISLDDNNLGLLLYGLNSCGKSSLLRSVGVCIILAQCGLYVPCSSFNYSPFSIMISQVDLTDNLFSGKSSFISEMCGLKKILSSATENTIILSDELCKGTESASAEAIVSSTIIYLLSKNAKFFFTSHLHRIPEINQIKNLHNLNIKHLSVTVESDNIIFDRKLKDGSGPDIYGLEVAKNIIQLSEFIDTAFIIRNDLIGNANKVISTKKSNYNKKKIMTNCEVCNYSPKKGEIPLDTHHIIEQKYANETGFYDNVSFHKNEKFNLTTLCKECHKKIDTGELIINGYKKSTLGIFLDYKLI